MPTPGHLMLLIGLVLAGAAQAALNDSFQVRSWHVENGLPDGTVTALAQTPDGYLWVGTQKGLVRFDGVNFNPVPQFAGAAPDDRWITGLLVDRQGALWRVSKSGLVTELAHGRTQVRCPARELPAMRSAAATNDEAGADSTAGLSFMPGRIALDGDGDVWVLREDGTVLRFQGAGPPGTPGATHLPSGSPGWLSADGSGGIWLSKAGRVYTWRQDEWVAVPEAGSDQASWLCACSAGREGLWVAGIRGSWLSGSWVRQRTPAGWQAPPLATPPAPDSARALVSTLLEDRQGRLWMGMYWSGVYVQAQAGKWERVQMQGPLAQSVVTCLLEDHDGAVWAGTIGEGLHQIVPKQVAMVMLPPDAGESIVNTAFADHDGAVWIGTDGKGIFRWEPGRFTRFGQAEGLPHEHVCAILQDAQSVIWAGTWAGLARFDGTRFVGVRGVPALAQPVVTLFADRSGRLWAGSTRGVCRRQDDGSWTVLTSAAADSNLDVRGITEDRAGHLWVAAIGAGLLQVRGDQLVSVGAAIGLDRKDVRCVLCDADDALWIGTLNNGLFRYAGGRLQHYSMADGLPDDSIISLVADPLGNLWMSSDNGIFGCSRRRLADYVRGQSPALLCWQLAPAQGLANRGCSGSGQPVASWSPDGRLWIADMRGVASFDPAMVTRGKSPPNVFVESVTADGVMLTARDGELRAPASTRRFEFHFAAPDLAAPQTLRFRYRLEPLDSEWVNAGAARLAAYSQLQPETYRFRVMVGGVDERWHEAATPVRLTVHPRLWQARWFQVLVLVVLVSAIAAGLTLNERRKLRRRLERMEAQQALETERRRIARDLHDDLGAGLAEVVLLGELSRQGNVPAAELPAHVSSMTDKTRALVTVMDEIVWTVNPRNDTVKSLGSYLSEHFQRFLAPARISARVSLPDDLPGTPLSAQFRHNIFLAVKEALHNVCKHSGAREVWLRLACTGNELMLRVEDDGKGFDPATVNGQRNGLENMRSRLEALGGRTRFESRPGHGTTVVFTLPLDRCRPAVGK